MILFFIFLLAVLVACFAIFKIGDAFSPWMITSAVWLGIFVLFSFYGDNLYPLSESLFTCVMIWVPILVFTSVLTYYSLPSPAGSSVSRHIELSPKWFDIFFIIAIVCSPLYLYQVIKVVMMFSTENLLSNIRTLANYGEKSTLVSLLKYVNAINQALYIIALWRFPKFSKWRFMAIICANLLCTVAIMSKTPVFVLFLSTLYILYEKRRIRLNVIFMWVALIIVGFYWINELRAQEVDKGSKFLDFFTMYVMSPPVAFGYAQEKLTDQFGTFSFAFFYAFASKLGLGVFYVQKQLQDFVFVPISTNVYTVFQPYYEDFGYKGVAFFASVWGLLMGWTYRSVRNGDSVAKCLYAYFVFAMVMQFYQENLFVNLSLVIQYIVIFNLLIKRNFSISFAK